MTQITYITGNLFEAPPGSILVHACNTVGSWGAGIALTFRAKYPGAFDQYKFHCKSHSADDIIGTCLLIPGEVHDVACLFTSREYGKRKDPPEDILAATRTAVQHLLKQNTGGKKLHACRFNSGKFAVPWEDTEAVLVELRAEMTVYSPTDTVNTAPKS